MASKKAKAPTQTSVVMVISGVVDSVDEEVVAKAVLGVERSAKKNFLAYEIDAHSAPITERKKPTDAEKEAMAAYVKKEMKTVSDKAVASAKIEGKDPVVLGSALRIHDAVGQAAASFFS